MKQIFFFEIESGACCLDQWITITFRNNGVSLCCYFTL